MSATTLSEHHLATPSGWFQIGWSDEWELGEVRPLRYFGRDLVSYRGRSGALVVLDAHCPHLGAHLGHGGTVVDDDIECPFHGWRWSAEGVNVDIPYSDRTNTSRTIDGWPVEEASGFAYLWHDAAGSAPWYAPPAVPEATDPGWLGFWPDAVHVVSGATVMPQMPLENTVDLAHLKYVHGWETMPTMADIEPDGPSFRSSFSGEIPTKRGVTAFATTAEAHGVGVLVSRLTGLNDTVQIMSTTPVDGDVSDVRFTVIVKQPDGEVNPRLIDAIVHAQTVAEWDKDSRIWEHMRYLDRPALAREEAQNYGAIRRWSRQFYPQLT